jgi:hypothetical protein
MTGSALDAARATIKEAIAAARDEEDNASGRSYALAQIARAQLELAHAEIALTPRSTGDDQPVLLGDDWARLAAMSTNAGGLLHTIGSYFETVPPEDIDRLLGWGWLFGQAIQAAGDSDFQRFPKAFDLPGGPWSRVLRMDFVEGQPAAGDPDRIILYLERGAIPR